MKKAVEELGYSPNLIAKQLTLRKTYTLGIVIPDLENSFFAYLVDSIIDASTERDYHIILTVSREKEEHERNNIRNRWECGSMACWCVSRSKPPTIKFLSMSRRLQIPLVFFDRAIKGMGFSHVAFDDRIGALQALNLLISRGYNNIAHFAGYSATSIGKERSNGYREALINNGIPVLEDWIIEGGFEIEDGIRAFEKLRQTGKLPQVILAVNDRVALGAYKAIRKTGLRIPEDIGIMGYGFSETAHLFSPTLSIINQDPRKMGKIAADLLIDEIQGISQKSHTEILIEEDFQWNTSIRRQ